MAFPKTLTPDKNLARKSRLIDWALCHSFGAPAPPWTFGGKEIEKERLKSSGNKNLKGI